jgi:hypothetical protein
VIDSPLFLGGSSIAAALLVIGITFARDGRLDKSDVGHVLVALGGGYMIPKGLFLCAYFFWPDPPAIATKLHGYEKEILFAGCLLIVGAVASIWSVCEKPPSPTGATKP